DVCISISPASVSLPASPSPPPLLALLHFFFLTTRPPPTSTLFPYTTLFRSKLRWRMARSRILRAANCDPQPAWSDGSLRPVRFRSEEHTSELQSLTNLVCRLLLEKKKTKDLQHRHMNQSEHTQ